MILSPILDISSKQQLLLSELNKIRNTEKKSNQEIEFEINQLKEKSKNYQTIHYQELKLLIKR